MLALASLATIVMGHDRPTVVNVLVVDARRAHPTMNIQQPRRVGYVSFDRILAEDANFFAKHISTNVAFSIENAGFGLLSDDLFIEIAMVRVKVRPEIPGSGQCRLRQQRTTA